MKRQAWIPIYSIALLLIVALISVSILLDIKKFFVEATNLRIQKTLLSINHTLESFPDSSPNDLSKKLQAFFVDPIAYIKLTVGSEVIINMQSDNIYYHEHVIKESMVFSYNHRPAILEVGAHYFILEEIAPSIFYQLFLLFLFLLFSVSLIILREINTFKAETEYNDQLKYTKALLERYTEMEQLQVQLSNTSQRLQSILDGAMNYLIITFNEAGLILTTNKGFSDMVGLSEDELINRPFFEMFDPPMSPDRIADIPDCHVKPKLKIYNLVAKDKSLIQIMLSCCKLPLVDEVVFLAMGRDITHEMEMQNNLLQTARLTAVGELAGGVAHEINNPLTGIISLSQIISDETDNAEIKFMSESIMKEGERIMIIVRDLQNFAFGNVTSEYYGTLMNELEVALRLIGKILTKDNIHVTFTGNDQNKQIKFNGQGIREALLYVLQNSREALNEKFPEPHDLKRIEIYLEVLQKQVHLAIKDNGVGIHEQYLNRVFDPFFTTKVRSTHRGVGLTIAHERVASHEGTISFESVAGEFTICHIKLPYV